MSPTSLTARNVSFAYEARETLSDVSLHIDAGEVVVLLGANGAGKTTLLKVLAGQLLPKTGDVLLAGKPSRSMSRSEVARRVCLMPQHENRETSLTVHDIVSLGRSPHAGWWSPWGAKDESIIRASIQSMGLWDLKDRNAGTLSGGEWRRMVLARSLAQEATILLLDEPTEGLDLRFQYECLEHVRNIVHQTGRIAILSLHDFQQASTFADRILVLQRGKITHSGTPEQILTPSIVSEAFGIDTLSVPHPVTGRPLIVANVDRPAH